MHCSDTADKPGGSAANQLYCTEGDVWGAGKLLCCKLPTPLTSALPQLQRGSTAAVTDTDDTIRSRLHDRCRCEKRRIALRRCCCGRRPLFCSA